ncbi:hypothetical protein ACFA67_004543 [Salmonella enterica]
MNELFWDAPASEILSNPQVWIAAAELEIRRIGHDEPAAVLDAVHAEFEAIRADEDKTASGMIRAKSGKTYLFRPAFFTEACQEEDRPLDAAWLTEMKTRITYFQQQVDAQALELELALSDFEVMPLAEAVDLIRLNVRLYESVCESLTAEIEQLHRAERLLVLRCDQMRRRGRKTAMPENLETLTVEG